MAFTSYQLILVVTLVVTGSINTLSTKWADRMSAKGSDGIEREFQHPFVQANAMFIGEFLCLIAFKILFNYYRRRGAGEEDTKQLVKGARQFNTFHLLVPALCDMCATSIMYVGLFLTYASSFQMLRGSVIVFVALLSVAFLNRRLVPREWTGIFIVILGLVIVGASDIFYGNNSHQSRNNIITGDLLIICAQVITSIQMVYEERYVAGLDIPALQAIGWEGLFGASILSILIIPMNFIKVPPPFNQNARGVMEDVVDAFAQMGNNNMIIMAIIGTIISIAFFNFAGISITKEISATTRMVLDSARTMFIWIISLLIGWQEFSAIQLVGFIILLCGMFLYNNVLLPQTYNWCCRFLCRRRYADISGGGEIIDTPAHNP